MSMHAILASMIPMTIPSECQKGPVHSLVVVLRGWELINLPEAIDTMVRIDCHPMNHANNMDGSHRYLISLSSFL